MPRESLLRSGACAAVALVGLGAATATATPAVAAPAASSVVRTQADGDDPLRIQTLADLGLPPEPTAQALASSVRAFTHLDDLWTVREFTTTGAVRALETVEHEADDTVVTLASDILFAADSAELSGAASSAVAALVADVPQGAALAVHGHTDSVDTEEHNLVLSQSRAQAVAAVIAAVRPDLVLDVVGLGESQPAVAEQGEDVGAARAANRRVELRYAG